MKEKREDEREEERRQDQEIKRSREDEDEREDEREENREERRDNFVEKCLKNQKIRQTNYLTMIRKKSLRTNFSFESSESSPCFQLFTVFAKHTTTTGGRKVTV